MKVASIVGARPQFIKAAPVSVALKEAGHNEVIVHTGQHYDPQMSDVFFSEMGIAPPDHFLAIGSGSHAEQTGRMMVAVERTLVDERPDYALVYGDTNTTLAAALAAVKLGVPLAHVEAGLRSFNRTMPEEHNRVLTDHCADLLFCPTQTAVDNLAREGIARGVHLVGDVMYDSVLHFAQRAQQRSRVLDSLGVLPGAYLLATVHRAYNTDDPAVLERLLHALDAIGEPVIFPLHPRTRARLGAHNNARRHVRLVDPVGYLDMLTLEKHARVILTDSGGVQKEAFFFQVPCVTLRPETEWVETVNTGWNVLAGSDPMAIVAAARAARKPPGTSPQIFGDGTAARRIAALLA
ncbi:MAG TPA: UDP-N-acetylglucosamine 2-epimerase (non-hydrolyzing) [Gemmatimonadaceae bacterium]|nr:UDP-N-acetylglucosamine 2-epimerase (non-hydrolyzing) [Gemmatimonadaceae bacterium]